MLIAHCGRSADSPGLDAATLDAARRTLNTMSRGFAFDVSGDDLLQVRLGSGLSLSTCLQLAAAVYVHMLE